MAKRRFSREYGRSELEFFFKNIDLEAVIQDYGYVPNRRKSGGRSQRVYVRGDRYITATIGDQEGIWIWCNLSDYKESGTLREFLMMEHFCGEKEACDKMREIAEADYGVDYQNFKDTFDRLNAPTASKPKVKDRDVKIKPFVSLFNLASYEAERARESDRLVEFSYKPAKALDFFLNRGISQETLNHPLFHGRFGNAKGPFGNNEQKAGQFEPTDFMFVDHIIVPYWDWKGRLVALEAKNRLTQEAYEKEISREISGGGNPRKVRRNQSKFYKDSSKQGAWLSNLPVKPKVLFITEQPANALAYFQLYSTNPDISDTIFMSTGGSLVDGHLAIMLTLIERYDIEKVIFGFDKDLAGLAYTLKCIQNLPFNKTDQKKVEVVFRKSAKYELEIDFVLLEGETLRPNSILTKVENIKKGLQNKFHFEGDVGVFPALTVGRVLATVSIPFTEKNAYEAIRLSQALLKTRDDVFQVAFPKIGKDLNDELQGTTVESLTPTYLLFDQPQNRNRIFITPKNTLIFHQRFTTFDHNIKEIVGRVNPFAIKHFIKPSETIIRYPFLMEALEKAQNDYQSSIPALKDDFVESSVKRSISFTALTREFMKAGHPIAHLSAEGSGYVFVGSVSEEDEKAIKWMVENINSGRDPNVPDIKIEYNEVFFRGSLIGRISEWFTFQEMEQSAITEIGPSGILQLELLLQEISAVRGKWESFREKYPEPILFYSSGNLIFMENKVPLFRFIPEKNQIELISSPEKVINRTFNSFFYKALQLFIENGGVFFNYIRLMRVYPEKGIIMYNTTDHEIGRLLSDGNQTYFALYPNIPESMKREMQLLAPFPEASVELISKHNVALVPSGLNAKIKENKMSTIPFQYLRFYDIRGKKFTPLSEEKLKRLPPSSQQLYTEAFIWHLNNIGSEVQTVGNEKEKFYERDGFVYFNRIPVAKYNVETDMLDTLTPPSSKYFQHLAIFERNLVQDPANRKYSAFLLSGSEEVSNSRVVTNVEIESILNKIELNLENNKLLIVDKSFSLREIGFLEGKRMVLNAEFMRYSDTFRDALTFFAKNLGHTLEWKSLVEETASTQTSLTSIEVPERAEVYEHNFLETTNGVIRSIANSPLFEGKITLDSDGRLLFHFLPNRNGQQEFPFGSEWDKVDKTLYWMSKQVEKPSTLVFTQDPDQAALYYQYTLPESMYEREMYLSVVHGQTKEMKTLVEKLMLSNGIKELKIVGDTDFIDNFQNAFKKNAGISTFPIPLITASQSLQRFKKFISTYKPDTNLQAVLDGITGHNYLNPADGIVVFPMRSESSNSRAILGSQLFISKDADSFWISRPFRNSRRIILVSNPEEAVYYMGLNKPYIGNDAIVSFQNKVTPGQVQFLTNQLKVPKFFGRIIVGNTGRLSEQLLELQFRLPLQIEKPLHETTFREEYLGMQQNYQKVKNDILSSRKRQQSEFNTSVGKSNAPAISEGLNLQEHKQQTTMK